VHLAAGTAGVLNFLLSTPWSLVYSDSGQAISAGAQARSGALYVLPSALLLWCDGSRIGDNSL
jgi:hypothetical protein